MKENRKRNDNDEGGDSGYRANFYVFVALYCYFIGLILPVLLCFDFLFFVKEIAEAALTRWVNFFLILSDKNGIFVLYQAFGSLRLNPTAHRLIFDERCRPSKSMTTTY
jgi:hypothetical protein